MLDVGREGGRGGNSKRNERVVQRMSDEYVLNVGGKCYYCGGG